MKQRLLLQRVAIVAAAAVAAACADQGTAPVEPPGLAPLHSSSPSHTVPDRYIVVLQAGADAPGMARQAQAAHGARVHYVYRHALNGFAATLSPQAVQALRRNPQVSFIEPDQEMWLTDTQSPATWGLDRIDQRSLPLNNQYTYQYSGAGVHVYVIDTGLRADHVEFTGRVGNGWSYIADGNGTNDCHSHGTHVAGTVLGTTWGVAKAAIVHPVRVFSCSGTPTTTSVIAGVDGVTANAIRPAVANMSLGGPPSTSLDNAVRNSIASRITYVVSAGNDNTSACNQSPARVAEAITVASTTSTDARSSFSNYGSCVDIFAPGSSITSAGIASPTASAVKSGTSMAAPHVAGVAAHYLQLNPAGTAAQAQSWIISNATTGKVTSAGTGSPNRLLYTPQPPPPLTAYISGIDFVSQKGTYTFEAMPSGGSGSYSYSWQITWLPSGNTTTAGTAKTQSLVIAPWDESVELKVTVTSSGQSVTATHRVYTTSSTPEW